VTHFPSLPQRVEFVLAAAKVLLPPTLSQNLHHVNAFDPPPQKKDASTALEREAALFQIAALLCAEPAAAEELFDSQWDTAFTSYARAH
jgi:hypothetical protein